MAGIDVIGLGAIAVDHVYTTERPIEENEAVISDAAYYPGGPAANTIHGLARLGLSCGFIGATGDDSDGCLLIDDLRQSGIDTSQIAVKPEQRSGSVIHITESGGRPPTSYVVAGANNFLQMDDVDIDYVNQARLVHMSAFYSEQQFTLCCELAERLAPSVMLSFAPGPLFVTKGIKALEPILLRTDVLFISQRQVEVLTGKNVIRAADICVLKGCRNIVVTLGDRHSHRKGQLTITTYTRDRSQECRIESSVGSRRNPSAVIDTNGGADAFATGFLFGLLEQKPLEECALMGDIVARGCINKTGPRAGLPTAEELRQRFGMHYFSQ